MKGKFWVLLSVLLFTSVLPSFAKAETYNFTYSNFFPPTHVQSKLAEEWCREVEKRTDGRVTISYFPGGTLTRASQCYDGVVQGLSDIGLSALAYSRGRFPVMAVVDLPLGYKSGVAATQVANAVYEKFKPAELDDVHLMYFHAHGPGLLHTAKKPVRKLEDLKGLKIRATGNSAKLVSALGGAPVAMSMPDSYQAIRRGVVNGGMYPIETNKGWKMAEVVDYCTLNYPVAYTTTFFVVMNKEKWEELPEDIQKIITEINKEWAIKHGQAWDHSDQLGKEFFEKKGGKFIALDEAEGNRWKQKAMPMMDEYVKSVSAKGVDGKAVLDFTVTELNSIQK